MESVLKIKGSTVADCEMQIRQQYPGREYTITSRELIPPRLFGRSKYEVSFWLHPLSAKKTSFLAGNQQKLEYPDLEAEKRKILQSRGVDPVVQQLVTQVQKLNEKLDTQVAAVAFPLDNHVTLQKVTHFLEDNDFSSSYIASIVSRIKSEFSFGQLEDFDFVMQSVFQWIGESIKIYTETEQHKPRVMVLVGSTGVGKTTTVAKLAAIFSGRVTKDCDVKDVRVITTDSFRLGAKEQIAKFGSIIGADVSTANSAEELRRSVKLFSTAADYILIDTTGNGPREYKRIAELNSILSSCKKVSDVHLVLSASTKSRDMKEVMEQYEPFGYRSVIMTKMDETVCVGNVISLLAEKNKQLSYITVGQGVPRDIEPASVYKLLSNLQGYTMDSAKLQEMFPVDEDNQIQWRKT